MKLLTNEKMSRLARKYLFLGLTLLFILYLAFYRSSKISNGQPPGTCQNSSNQVSRKTTVSATDGSQFEYDRSSPIIFIGGVARSGSNLMRSILDQNPDVHCRKESIILPKVLQMRQQWNKSQKESLRLAEAGMSSDVLDSAFSVLILEVLARLDEPKTRLCNKDLAILKYGSYLKQLFPKSKFIFMIRDARATVHSIIKQKEVLPGYNLKSYKASLIRWNNETLTMNKECEALGPDACLKVYYEQLVLNPKDWLYRISKFLEVSPQDPLFAQAINPVDSSALSDWVGQIPDDVVQEMETLVPMMKKLGYDPSANPPQYSKISFS